MTSKDKKQPSQELPTMPFVINGQYIKDLSFENPNPLKTLVESKENPAINVSIDVQAQPVADKSYEVTLQVHADAKKEDICMFIIELTYAGIFTIEETDKQKVHSTLLIKCPQMLFPYARSIVANTTREGGFPPLSLSPIDFAQLYKEQHPNGPKSSATK